MTERYIELHAASAFSFLEGASLPEDLIQRAAELDMPAMALLDRNGVYGAAEVTGAGRREWVRCAWRRGLSMDAQAVYRYLLSFHAIRFCEGVRLRRHAYYRC